MSVFKPLKVSYNDLFCILFTLIESKMALNYYFLSENHHPVNHRSKTARGYRSLIESIVTTMRYSYIKLLRTPFCLYKRISHRLYSFLSTFSSCYASCYVHTVLCLHRVFSKLVEVVLIFSL